MCKACDVTFKHQNTGVPATFADYASECLAEVDKVSDWLFLEGYCEETYAFPLCDNEAFDPIGNPIEGPDLGVARPIPLQGLGGRQTDRTDFRSTGTTTRTGKGDACLCTQGPEACSCRDNVWTRRPST